MQLNSPKKGEFKSGWRKCS